MSRLDPELRERCINTLRFLAVDAIEKARSGHPGMAMGAATAAFVVWHDFLCLDPARPDWPGRDRFILSGGHASALLYALIHSAGLGLGIEDLQSFRQWHSRTPGHPEVGLTPGVETTSGPLGQGFANGVGMGLAARMLGARLGPEGEALCRHRIFALVSDGDIQEGISHEAASLAGHLGLGNLVYIYDSNRITIEGSTDLSMSEDVGRRFEALGWFVQRVDGHDADAVHDAVARACEEKARPSFIVSSSHIGYGSPKQDTAACHGEPLGPAAVAETRRALGWPAEPFFVPEEVRAVWRRWAERGRGAREQWERTAERFAASHPELAARLLAMQSPELPDDLLAELVAAVEGKAGATRALSGKVIQRAAELVPALVGGSADLAPSTKTRIDREGDAAAASMGGRNLHFGVREHAMAAIANGIALHGPFRPYVGTFLVFSDYMRPAIRLAAFMERPVTFVLTHDSFFVGEDGPTHQPVEHLWSLRLVPGLAVWRPADAVEVAVAWAAALETDGKPHVLALSRQELPALARPAGFDPRVILRGAYVLSEVDRGEADVTLVGTGSEVSLAIDAAGLLAGRGVRARVVSMPCVGAFLAADDGYRESVLPREVPTVAIEAGVTEPWRSLVGRRGLVIGLDTFGFSAPAETLRQKLGFTPDQVAARIEGWLAAARSGAGPT